MAPDKIIENAKEEIGRLEAELKVLRDLVQNAQGVSSNHRSGLVSVGRVVPGQWKRTKHANVAIREYVNMKGSPASVDELIEVLPRGGFRLSSRPSYANRQIVLAVDNSPYLEKRNGLVYALTDPNDIQEKEKETQNRGRNAPANDVLNVP